MRHLIPAILLLAAALPSAAAPLLQYSQDGQTYLPFNPVVGRERVANYYDYYNYAGHPDFGLVAGVTTAAFYYDQKRDALSLIVISGSGDDSGKVSYGFQNLPSTAYLNLCDDPGEFSYAAGASSAEALFRWNQQTDGLVFSGLENQPLGIKISIKPYVSVSNLRLAAANNQFFALDLSRPLYVRTQPVGGGTGVGGGVTPPVPEPAATALAAVALLGWLSRRLRD